MGLEGLPKSQEEIKNKQPKTESKQNSGLYNVVETEDGDFEAILPGLFDKERGLIVGTSRKRFKSREEADEAINSSRESSKTMFERSSLEKSFTEHFYRIDETEDGKYKVTLPGLRDSKTGYYVGTTSKEFGSWNEARDFYLQQLENESRLTEGSIFEVKIGEAAQVVFSDFDSFDPRVAPSEEFRAVPQSVEKYILQRERMAGEAPSASTYQETIQEEAWERKIYAFVASYLEKDGEEIAQELGIKNLDLLTPRQAVDLTTRLVFELTKYKWSDTKEERGNDLTTPEKSNADQSTALKLLQEGHANKCNDDWDGNGVCRNFASMTKAVFEALKANQTQFNYLQDTYCLYDNGMDEFAPKRGKKNVTEMSRTGHAWNTFVTVSKNEVNATIIDTTWAKRNLDTGKVEGLDYTLTRMEPVIHRIATELPEDAPDRVAQLEHILSYYQLKMESPSQIELDIPPVDELDANQRAYYKRLAEENFGTKYDLSQANEKQLVRVGQQFRVELLRAQKQKEENNFFSSRVVDILKQQKELPQIPPGLLKIIGEEYKTLAEDTDPSEIETLWRVSKTNPNLPFGDILKSYLKDKSLTNYHAREFIFDDNELQQAIFEQVKAHPKFKEFMRDSPTFRIKMREALPGLFMGFYPGANESDTRELKQLIDNSRLIRFGHLLNTRQPSEESANKFFAKARESLQSINLEKYKQIAENVDDYELVKRYDFLYSQLKIK